MFICFCFFSCYLTSSTVEFSLLFSSRSCSSGFLLDGSVILCVTFFLFFFCILLIPLHRDTNIYLSRSNGGGLLSSHKSASSRCFPTLPRGQLCPPPCPPLGRRKFESINIHFHPPELVAGQIFVDIWRMGGRLQQEGRLPRCVCDVCLMEAHMCGPPRELLTPPPLLIGLIKC